MTNTHFYFDEIASTCALIERLFNATEQDQALQIELIDHFSPDFSMLTSTGKRLDRAQLGDFFSTMVGRKQGLKIEVSEPSLLWESGHAAVLTYVETQTQALDNGIEVRLATVLLEKERDGGFLWRHLHESTRA